MEWLCWMGVSDTMRDMSTQFNSLIDLYLRSSFVILNLLVYPLIRAEELKSFGFRI